MKILCILNFRFPNSKSMRKTLKINQTSYYSIHNGLPKWRNYLVMCVQIRTPYHTLAMTFLLSKSETKIMQMLLDCSVIPEVIRSALSHGSSVYDDLFYVGRTWCFAVHRERMKRLHLWNFWGLFSSLILGLGVA